MDKDLFDLDDETGSPQDSQPAVEAVEEEPGEEDEAEVVEEVRAEEEDAGEEKDTHNDHNSDDDNADEDNDDEADQQDAPATTTATAGEAKAAEEKQGNVVEQDPYEFDKCLVSIAIALMPDDGNPEGRPVMLGVRNHQEEPLMGACRLSDLMPLPDPVQQLIDQLAADLPGRSERNAKRLKEKEEQEAKLKAAREKGKKTAGKERKSSPANKAKMETPASVNLFEMFDQ